MSFLARLLIALCVLAGMANGMAHKPHDECAAQHSHEHGDTQGSHDGGDGKSTPHQHTCCHLPSADRAPVEVSAIASFQPILVEIPTDVSLAPEEPVFALDKPPLI